MELLSLEFAMFFLSLIVVALFLYVTIGFFVMGFIDNLQEDENRNDSIPPLQVILGLIILDFMFIPLKSFINKGSVSLQFLQFLYNSGRKLAEKLPI